MTERQLRARRYTGFSNGQAACMGSLRLEHVLDALIDDAVSKLDDVVEHVDDQHFLGTAILRTAQTTPDHLLITDFTASRARDVDGVGLRRIKALR